MTTIHPPNTSIIPNRALYPLGSVPSHTPRPLETYVLPSLCSLLMWNHEIVISLALTFHLAQPFPCSLRFRHVSETVSPVITLYVCTTFWLVFHVPVDSWVVPVQGCHVRNTAVFTNTCVRLLSGLVKRPSVCVCVCGGSDCHQV